MYISTKYMIKCLGSNAVDIKEPILYIVHNDTRKETYSGFNR